MTAYEKSTDRSVAVSHLTSDSLRHSLTLKMLSLHPEACVSTIFENSDGWACVTEMNTEVSRWDRSAYPRSKRIVTFDGNNDLLLRAAFDLATKGESVFKVHDPITRPLVAHLPGYRLVQAFLSYSTSNKSWLKTPATTGICECTELTPEALHLLAQNGYTAEELQGYFLDGARWFGLTKGSRCVCACLVYRNYQDIWEIGAVYTVPEERGKGYAKSVVSAAAQTLLRKGCTPRYVFRSDNDTSRAVAEGIGLKHVLTIEHFASTE